MPSLALNKDARYRYDLLETFTAGLILTGQEVKSVKLGQVSLKGSYISWRQHKGISRLYLVGAHVSAYKYATNPDFNPLRERELLLNKSEITRLLGKTAEKGLTLIPLKLYTERSFVKLEFALARGKKLHDKRESLKKKAIDRDLKRTLKIK